MLVYRDIKGSPLTNSQIDENFRELDTRTAISVTPEQFGTVDGIADDVQIQAAINSLTNGGMVLLGVKTYSLSTSIKLKYGVSICGTAGRSTVINTTGNFPAIEWHSSLTNYDKNISIRDIWLTGSGKTSGGANNSGILINHPMGIDGLQLSNLYITQFGNYAIETKQLANPSGHNCFQFSHWDSVLIDNCKGGILMGVGFCGESLFSNINIQYCTDNAVRFVNETAGPQGLTFDSCVFGQGTKGVVFDGASRGNITFRSCHFEALTVSCVEVNNIDNDKLIFNDCWFILNDTSTASVGILAPTGKYIVLYSCSWKASRTDQKYIYLSAASSLLVALTGVHVKSGTVLTTEISTVSITSIQGQIFRTSTSTGTINSQIEQINNLQTRGIMSESATVLPQNLAGSIAIGNGVTSVAVTFNRAEPDTSFLICANTDYLTNVSTWMPGVSIGSKTVNGFTAYLSSAAPAGGYQLNWILVR